MSTLTHIAPIEPRKGCMVSSVALCTYYDERYIKLFATVSVSDVYRSRDLANRGIVFDVLCSQI